MAVLLVLGMSIVRPDSDGQLGDLQPDSHTDYKGQVGEQGDA